MKRRLHFSESLPEYSFESLGIICLTCFKLQKKKTHVALVGVIEQAQTRVCFMNL